MADMITMNAKDAVSGSLGECYVTLEGKRYNLMTAIKFEASYDKTKTEVPILGKVSKGNKSVGGKGSGTMTVHYNAPIFRELLEKYQNTRESVHLIFGMLEGWRKPNFLDYCLIVNDMVGIF